MAVGLLLCKSQDTKFSQQCAQLFFVSVLVVLLLSICYSDSKPNCGSENENGFYVWSNNLNGFPSVSLSALLWKPVAIYLLLSNYSLVNTEKRKAHRKHGGTFTIAKQEPSTICHTYSTPLHQLIHRHTVRFSGRVFITSPLDTTTVGLKSNDNDVIKGGLSALV